MIFEGRYYQRSSKPGSTGPSGEKALRPLNPERYAKMLALMKWERIEDGTANVRVDHRDVERLLVLKPSITEEGRTVTYPGGARTIQDIRKGWLYYAGEARYKGKMQEVLVRRGIVPLVGVLELFAQENLAAFFGLQEGYVLTVEVRG
jgi:hypothetical protein